jgi:hypothetical protein
LQRKNQSHADVARIGVSRRRARARRASCIDDVVVINAVVVDDVGGAHAFEGERVDGKN